MGGLFGGLLLGGPPGLSGSGFWMVVVPFWKKMVRFYKDFFDFRLVCLCIWLAPVLTDADHICACKTSAGAAYSMGSGGDTPHGVFDMTFFGLKL